MQPPEPSPNFAYLAHHDPRLTARAAAAERFFGEDPATCLMNLRVFGELLAKRAAAYLGVELDPRATQVDVLRSLNDRGALGYTVRGLFHQLRIAGNDAAHEAAAAEAEALHQLKMARELGIWFQRTFGNNRKFDPGPFVPPASMGARSEGTETELERLRKELLARQAEVEAGRGQLEAARAAADREQQGRLSAEERAQRAAEERAPVRRAGSPGRSSCPARRGSGARRTSHMALDRPAAGGRRLGGGLGRAQPRQGGTP